MTMDNTNEEAFCFAFSEPIETVLCSHAIRLTHTQKNFVSLQRKISQ